METSYQILIGIFLLLIFWVIKKSIIIPKPRWIMCVKFLGKPTKMIENIPGKKINEATGDVVDLPYGEKKRINVYFFLYPFYKIHEYPFSYAKEKKGEDMDPGDIPVWADEGSNTKVIIRKGTSNHLEFRAEYPNISPSLDTQELGVVNVFTNNIIEIVNPMKAMFSIDNWMGLTMSSLNGILRGIVANKKIPEINKLNSEDNSEFNESMAKANQDQLHHPGLLSFGVKLTKSIFKDFEAANEFTKGLMESYGKVDIADQEGKAKLKKQEGETAAYKLQTDTEIEQEKKRRVQTGVAKTDDKGNIVELVPEANTKIIAENIGKLKDLHGTLIIGGETANMLNIKTS